MIKKSVITIAAFAFFTLLPAISFADSQTFNGIFFQPAIGRNTYLMLNETRTLHKWQLDVGEITSYGWQPLKMKAVGAATDNAIDQLLVADFIGAVGVLEWLQLGVDLPVVMVNEFRNPLVTPTPSRANHADLSDMRVEVKARLLDNKTSPIGLALIPFMTLPTGDDAHYVGDPGPTGGFKVAVDGQINDKVGLAMNVGYQGGRKVHLRNLEYQQRLLMGGGIDVTPVRGLDIFGEVNATAGLEDHFRNRETTPAEAMIGARWDVGKTGISISGAGGTCIVCGTEGAKVRAVLGLTYRYNSPKYQRMDEVALAGGETAFDKELKEIEAAGYVHFKFNSAQLDPGEREKIDKVIAVVNRSKDIKRIDVVGHTDNIGAAWFNRRLSVMRAAAVIDYVKKRGVRPDVKLDAVGLGAGEPLSPNKTASDRAINRRAVFTVIDGE